MLGAQHWDTQLLRWESKGWIRSMASFANLQDYLPLLWYTYFPRLPTWIRSALLKSSSTSSDAIPFDDIHRQYGLASPRAVAGVEPLRLHDVLFLHCRQVHDVDRLREEEASCSFWKSLNAWCVLSYTLGVQRIKNEKEREITNLYVCVKKKISEILENVKDRKRSNKWWTFNFCWKKITFILNCTLIELM